MAFIRWSLHGALLAALVFCSLPSANADSRVTVVQVEDPYLFGWSWDGQPDSMVRIPRGPASLQQGSDDHPLRVQRELPRYRHFRSAAQIHWEIAQEAAE